MRDSTRFVKLWESKVKAINDCINTLASIYIGVYDENNDGVRIASADYVSRYDKVILDFDEGDIDMPVSEERVQDLIDAVVEDLNKHIEDLGLHKIGLHDPDDMIFRIAYFELDVKKWKVLAKFIKNEEEELYDALRN